MGDALLDPLGDAGALFVGGEGLLQALRPELQLAGGRGDGVLDRVLVELVETGRPLLPVGGHGQHRVLLLLELLPGGDLLEVHADVGALDELFVAEAVGDLVEHAHLLGDGADHVVVGAGLADRLDGPVHEDDALEAVALADARGDVVALEGGGDGEDDVGAEDVVLQPGMLGDDALDLRDCGRPP